MAPKSDVVQKLNHFQQLLFQPLKPLGFRRRGRTLYRPVESDILQIFTLQTGQFEVGRPPLPPEIAYLLPTLYGKFTVNLGVFVPEMHERFHPEFPPRGVVSDVHCRIRVRLTKITSHEDIWWPLADDPEALIDEIGSLLIGVGIPFLDRFGSRDAIIRDWVHFNEHELRLTQVARLDTAMILLKRGKVGAAKALFEEHIVEFHMNPLNPGHGPYVRQLARRLGLGELS